MDIEKCLLEFTNYVDNYDMKNIRIKLKYTHSIRVMKLMEIIANYLKLSPKDIALAKLIGLLHDVGRFEQLKKFKSFNDKNIDHGDYAEEILFQDNLIRNYLEDDKYDDIIRVAIKYHNKYKMPSKLSRREKLFTMMIRDADKIDIFYVLTIKKYSNFISKPSKKNIERLLNGKSIRNENNKNGSDVTIGTMAFLNDINFNESFKVLRTKKYIEKWLDSVNVSEEQSETFLMLKDFTVNKLKEGVIDVRQKV